MPLEKLQLKELILKDVLTKTYNDNNPILDMQYTNKIKIANENSTGK
jgi:hypothetical protein